MRLRLALRAPRMAYTIDISYIPAQAYEMSDVPVAASRFLFGVPEELEQLLSKRLPSPSRVVFEHAREDIFRRLAQERFEVVVVDLAMPSLSGVDFIQLVQHCSSPIVILPADLGSRANRAALREWDELQARLTELLDLVVVAPQKPRQSGRRGATALEPIESVRRRVLKAAFEQRGELLRDSLSAPEVAELLRVTRQTPHDRVKNKALLGIEDKGSWRFPPWQFDANGPNGVIQGLPDVLAALHVGPLAQARWLTQPNRVFDGRSPLDALRKGEVARVIAEARGVGAEAGS